MFRKSDLLALGHHNKTQSGCLHISFDAKAGSADLVILREVLSLFDAQVTYEGKGLDSTGRTVPNQVGYGTDLPYTELATLNFGDSFPILAANRAKALQDAVDAKQRLQEIEEADQAKRVAAQQERENLNRARIAGIGY